MRFYYRRENVTPEVANVQRKSLLDTILEQTSSVSSAPNLDHAPVSVPVQVGTIAKNMKFIAQRRMGKSVQIHDGVDISKIRALAQEILDELSKEPTANDIHSLAEELVSEINPEVAHTPTTGVANPLASGTTPIVQATDTFMFNLHKNSQRKAS